MAMLEMEEAEDVVPLRAPPSRLESASSSSSQAPCSGRFGKGAASLIIGVMIGSSITSDMVESLRFWDSGGAPTRPPILHPTSHPTFPPSHTPTQGPLAKSGTPTIHQTGDFGATFYPAQPHTVLPDPPLTPDRANDLAKQWGKWNFVDKDKDKRPGPDFFEQYPNRDVPRDKFPTNAWQTDSDYLQGWFEESLKLIDRAQEAILTEYGFGKKDFPDKSFDERSETFQIRFIDLQNNTNPPSTHDYPQDGGFTSERGFQGLVRRLLHAIMTQDTFTFVLGGHSAAAGHGNYFQQSYTMQFHKVMEPVFSLLGAKLRSHNFAQGGLGTIQSSLGMKSIYGDEIDVIVWDSSMTEGDVFSQEVFVRQALISGNRVPFIFGGKWQTIGLADRHDADVGQFGVGMSQIPECKDELHAETIAYAARFLKCSSERKDMCNSNKFLGNCWVDRPDVIPPTPQNDQPGSRVAWHPGFRWHQIVGRSIAFTILRALKQALTKWKQADNYILPDTYWHVTAYYNNIQKKMRSIVDGECEAYIKKTFEGRLGPRICNLALQGRTEFTPRANPATTSIQSIIKPNELGYVPHLETAMLYTGPNVHNPMLDLPDGAPDVLAIVSNGRTYDRNPARRHLDNIEPGLGWELHAEMQGYCDGSYNSECGRDPADNCLYYGHNDSRGGFSFDSYSGWLVMTLPQVKEGVIVAKIETWHQHSEMIRSKGWTSIDNKGRRKLRSKENARTLSKESESYKSNTMLEYNAQSYTDSAEWIEMEGSQRRRVKKVQTPVICDNFSFEISIDGKLSVWNKDEFVARSKVVQRVVELQVLLDDPDFISERKDVELAIRMTGCGDSTQTTMRLTHIYFA